MKYKRSIYNIVIDEFQNGDLLLFNSSSCGFGIMKSKYINLYNCIEELNMDILSSEDELFISAMTNNGFLVEYDLDEFAALEVDEKIARYSSHAGKTLTIAPTLGCNMNCPYCFENHKNRKGMNQETKLKLVKFVEKFLDDAKAFRVIWFGGEPLIEFETIRELSKEFIKICNSRNISYEPSIVTNGILLDYEKAKILTEECKINHAQITIDGLEETHNKRRRLINNKDSFKVIVNNIESIKELLDISIRVNIDKNNEDQMEKLIDYFILV